MFFSPKNLFSSISFKNKLERIGPEYEPCYTPKWTWIALECSSNGDANTATLKNLRKPFGSYECDKYLRVY